MTIFTLAEGNRAQRIWRRMDNDLYIIGLDWGLFLSMKTFRQGNLYPYD